NNFIPHLVNNPVALSACCLSSRLFVPATITLETEERRSSPTSAVASHVHCLRIIDPRYFNDRKWKGVLTSILDLLRLFVVDLQIFRKYFNGIYWPHQVWLQDAISHFRSLRSFITEDWFMPFPVTYRPSDGNIAALGWFESPSYAKKVAGLERLPLSAFRLSKLDIRSLRRYLNSGLLEWLDLSSLRALAFCTKTGGSPDTTGAWLSALIKLCSTSLEYLVFEPVAFPNDLELPFGGCPRLKRVTIIAVYELDKYWDYFLLPWAEELLDRCPSLKTGEITFSLTADQFWDSTEATMDPRGLLIGIVELKRRFPTCSIIFSHPFESLVLKQGCFPPSLVIKSPCTYIDFWSEFYHT
ncbi:hypothetical protein DL96DRAFT_1630866, partial [Flagelloscypha sp. PMI_526]